MIENIVTRLREMTQVCESPNCSGCEIESAAADEIERLQAEVDRLNTALQAVFAAASEAVHGE